MSDTAFAEAARSGTSMARAAAEAVDVYGEQLVLRLGLGPSADLDAPLMSARTRRGPSEIAMLVAAFHRAFDLPRQALPSLDGVERELLALRTALLDEETAEFADAAARRDLVGMADALADVVYVSYGTAVTLGIDLDAVLREVHRSNMSKLDGRGRPVLRDDGKVLKSPRYTRPDVASVLQEQLPLPL
jgi:predicted HAD superfamily Cof-like phosphohydrolase